MKLVKTASGEEEEVWIITLTKINYIPMTLHSACNMQRQFIDIHFLCIHT